MWGGGMPDDTTVVVARVRRANDNLSVSTGGSNKDTNTNTTM